jgi:uroporphyrinogen III methyltransferase/synthase
VIQAPVIRTRTLPGPPLDPSPYDLICVSSPNGADGLVERLAEGGRDMRSLAGRTIAAIGPGTARALAGHGVRADIVPERFVAEGLIEALAEVPVERALIVRPRTAREVLPDALRARGAHVDVLELYETVAEPLSSRVLEQARNADYITFTSSSTVGFFVQAAGGEGALSEDTRIISIGPATSASLREHGLAPDVQAERHDIDGIIDALLADAAGEG